ncbi:TRAP transporter substrate-binding protein [Terrihabitans rhizophilus]|jgi:TRAP-type C4-dicarboxylate transport system substrate-binding protein|uniref:TRAP transporter substrate-binding protein n=1 Tax=Terrihabitans rhizophilus TaxID=3092662 RepID=A0ABU4RP40_9HYPH|nr:TRAP transporter substrate-binding protein [Terrihabitans sp. PJ23]MDX6805953.1 TRAP transporter substrate-binding protein [Terrihabitans sp. PJ23]
MRRAIPFAAAAVALLAATTFASAQTPLRVAGNFSQNNKQVDIERAFFGELGEKSGVPIQMNYNPMDVVGVKAPDALRMLRGGSFDVMSVQIGMASRDDPFFEGVDLIGVAPDMASLRKVVDAYREAFDERLQKRFNAKVLTLWPFGPQVFYCNHPITTLADLKGLKVRSFTPSMSAMLENLGATPVTLQFSEVYPALQRGVASCGVTSPTSGNTGNWPEVTTHLLPLAVSGSVQGHFINLNTWKKFSPEQQQKLTEQFKALEDQFWQLATSANDDAIACNTGQDSCSGHKKFSMKLVEISDADRQKIKEVAESTVLPIWKKTCDAVDPQCSENWNKTAGAAAGLTIK